MTVIDNKSAASLIIAEVIGCDWDEVREMVYQPTVYRSPRVYSWDDNPWSYFCCPTARQKLPKGFRWEEFGVSPFTAHKNRPVYGARYEAPKDTTE